MRSSAIEALTSEVATSDTPSRTSHGTRSAASMSLPSTSRSTSSRPISSSAPVRRPPKTVNASVSHISRGAAE